MTPESTTMETTPAQTESLIEVMNDLARSADTQAARAAAVDDIDTSSALFALAALLRSEAAGLLEKPGTHEHCREVLAGAQHIVARQMLRLDRTTIPQEV